MNDRHIAETLLGAANNLEAFQASQPSHMGIVPHDNMPYPYIAFTDGLIFCPFRPLMNNKPMKP